MQTGHRRLKRIIINSIGSDNSNPGSDGGNGKTIHLFVEGTIDSLSVSMVCPETNKKEVLNYQMKNEYFYVDGKYSSVVLILASGGNGGHGSTGHAGSNGMPGRDGDSYSLNGGNGGPGGTGGVGGK
jgi:hypothetical protein